MGETDLSLVKRAKNGDASAFEELVVLYQKKVYNLSLRMCGNTEDAFDLSQETFLRAYKALPFFKEKSSFSTWIYSIATNVCIDFARKQNRFKTVPLHMPDENNDDIAFDIPDTRYQPETEYEKAELREAVARGLQTLSPEHREILVLREIGGLSYREIGDSLNLEPGTVKSRINRARLQLCAFLGNNPRTKASNNKKAGGKNE